MTARVGQKEEESRQRKQSSQQICNNQANRGTLWTPLHEVAKPGGDCYVGKEGYPQGYAPHEDGIRYYIPIKKKSGHDQEQVNI